MHDLNDILFFATVVKCNGFSAAARALCVPKSSVSRHVDRLEKRLGVRLLERSTRSVRLTDAGSAYYVRCEAIVAEIAVAEEYVVQLGSEPSGTIRVSCPPGFAHFPLAQILPGFMILYPSVRIQVVATNRRIDLIEDKVDVAIRARTKLQDEALTMRKLGTSHFIFVASPSFETAHTIPVNPSEMGDLPFLSFRDDAVRHSWTVIGPKGQREVVFFNPILWTSDFNVLIEVTSAGQGIAFVPAEIADRHIRDGRLTRVFPSWHSEDITVHVVFKKGRGLSPAVRAFVDYLVKEFKVPSTIADATIVNSASAIAVSRR